MVMIRIHFHSKLTTLHRCWKDMLCCDQEISDFVSTGEEDIVTVIT